MIDREKVIKGLECHAVPGGNCLECPYGKYGVDENGLECENKMAADALELLKAQEPRVLTVDEFDQALDTVVWYDSRDSENLSTSYVLLTGYSLMHTFVEFRLMSGTEVTGTLYRYNKDWRLWSSRPTDEQREAVKWND